MDKNTLQTKWSTVKNQIRQKFNKLTDEDLNQINGNRTTLLSKIQQRYGYDTQKAEKELVSFESSCGCGHSTCSSTNEREEVAAASRPSQGGHRQETTGNRPGQGTNTGKNKNR